MKQLVQIQCSAQDGFMFAEYYNCQRVYIYQTRTMRNKIISKITYIPKSAVKTRITSRENVL